MTNQLSLFQPPAYIPVFNARHRIAPEMEAVFAEVYRKRVASEGHMRRLPETQDIRRGYTRSTDPSPDPTKSKKEVILALFRKPVLRSDVMRRALMLGMREGTVRHHIDSLMDLGAVKKYGKLVTDGGYERQLFIAVDGAMQIAEPVDTQILAALDEPKTRSQIADDTGIHKRTVENMTLKLERKGRIIWTGEYTSGQSKEKIWQRVKE